MTRIPLKILIFAAFPVFLGAAFPELAFAATPPFEPDLQSLLNQHAAQCREHGCTPLELWRSWVGPALIGSLALVLGYFGIIRRPAEWLEQRFKRTWVVTIGLAAILAAAWLVVPTAMALLNGKSPGTTGVAATIRYKDAHGNWVEAARSVPTFGEEVLDWLGDAYLPVFLISLLALVILTFLMKRLNRNKLAALVVGVTVAFSIFSNLELKDNRPTLPPGSLRDRIEAMAAPLGYTANVVQIGQIFDSGVGIHNAKAHSFPVPKIVLAQSLVANHFASYQGKVQVSAASDRQLAALVGHELAHLELHHQAKRLLLLGIVSLTIGFSLATLALRHAGRLAGTEPNATHLSAIALPLLAVAYMASTSLTNLAVLVAARQQEREADARGIELSGDPAGFAQLLVVINTGRDMAQPDLLDRLLNSHPPVQERIDAAIAQARPRP